MRTLITIVVSLAALPASAAAGLPIEPTSQQIIFGGTVQSSGGLPVTFLGAQDDPDGDGRSGEIRSNFAFARFDTVNDPIGNLTPNTISGYQRVESEIAAQVATSSSSNTFARTTNRFLVTGPVAYTATITAEIALPEATSGVYNASVYMNWFGVGGTPVFTERLGSGQTGVNRFTVSGVLDPAGIQSDSQTFVLEFISTTSAFGDSVSPGVASVDLEYEIVFRAVPSPSTIYAIGGFGILAARRRR